MKKIIKKVVAVLLAVAVVFGAAGINQISTKAVPNPEDRYKITVDWDALRAFMDEHRDMKWGYHGVDGWWWAEITEPEQAKNFIDFSDNCGDVNDLWFELIDPDTNTEYGEDHLCGPNDRVYLHMGVRSHFNPSVTADMCTASAFTSYFDVNGSVSNVSFDSWPSGEIVKMYIDMGTFWEFMGDPNPNPDPEPDPEPEGCVYHDWTWFIEGEDEILRCKKCGEVVIDAANHMNEKTADSVYVEMKWNSLPARIVKKIEDAGKETTFHYWHKGYEVTIKVPAGCVKTVPETEWYGPEFLADLYRNYDVTVKNWRGTFPIDVLFE